jgi:hypothetical protein
VQPKKPLSIHVHVGTSIKLVWLEKYILAESAQTLEIYAGAFNAVGENPMKMIMEGDGYGNMHEPRVSLMHKQVRLKLAFPREANKKKIFAPTHFR